MDHVTRAEASLKFCPLSRIGGALQQCVADGCMAWRQVETEQGESKLEGIRRRREETGCGLVEAKEYVEGHPAYLIKPKSDLGFCGLAGRPE